MNLAVVVLVAGQGAALKSRVPKVLHPIAGRPMAYFVLDAVLSLEPVRTVIVVGHGADRVRAALGEDVAYAYQQKQRGTGYAVQQTSEMLAGQAQTVLILYGDTALIRPQTLRAMVEHHERKDATVTLLTFRPENPAGYGRIVRERQAGQVRAIVSDSEATPEQRTIGEVDSGILCVRDAWLWTNLNRLAPAADDKLHLSDLVTLAFEQNELVTALAVADPLEVMALTQRSKLARAEAEMRRRINEQWMLEGVTIIHPETTYIEAGVEIGTDTVIWPNTYLQGQTRIGSNCIIGPSSIVRDSQIGTDCRIELSVVEQAIMEDESNVGPFGHLRKGAHLGSGVHMGNFGEVKNSYLGSGAKMGHFSYLGDATVGAGANIGAGTVTCNYDGEHKHPTVIGEEAFIGSGSMLVAPVTIGRGAKVGAGSVVTHDVLPDSVAYGVPARNKSEPEAEGSEGD
ncbi:MAG: bifunctional UDP-N-acetylglucosamine diphosphorylase/glucosamine-1-phosphate N-acetyltransferase GlmU [Anaerolineae bacterium]